MKTQGRDIFKKYTDEATFEKIKEFDTISQMWSNCIQEYSDTVAIEDNDQKYTYADIENDASSFRSVLLEAGLQAGDRVGLLIPNSYSFVSTFVAVTTLGLVGVILPAQLPKEAVYGLSKKFNLKAIVFAPTLLESVSLVQGENSIPTIDCTTTSKTKTPLVQLEKSSHCVIMLTGGTTGKSKGALLSHGAVLQGTINGCYGYKDVFGQKYLLVLPLSHVFGLIRNLLTCLYTGGTLYICRNNQDMFRDIAKFGPNILVLVPALAEMALTLSKNFKRNMLGPDMKYIICGAAAVAPYLVEEYSKLGIALFPGYGLTESANLVSGNPEYISKPSSVGYMYPNQEYKVVDGELWLKGENMLCEYVGEPEQAYTDGWFKTGDLVRFDDDGAMYIVGRCKEVIVLSNGENVSPQEVEAKFNTLTLIADSQVFEDINDRGEHILALEVVPRATETATIQGDNVADHIKAELEKINNTLPGYMQVQKITVRDSDFERTPSMKIVRYKKCN